MNIVNAVIAVSFEDARGRNEMGGDCWDLHIQGPRTKASIASLLLRREAKFPMNPRIVGTMRTWADRLFITAIIDVVVKGVARCFNRRYRTQSANGLLPPQTSTTANRQKVWSMRSMALSLGITAV